MTDPTTTPDNIVEAISLLRSLGYEDELDVGDHGLVCDAKGFTLALQSAKVDHVFRFEGASDPSDSSIVLGVSSQDGAHTGILVSSYGADIDPRYEAALDALEF